MNNERLITPEEFNHNIKQWSQKARNKMVSTAPRSDKESGGRHLKDSISYQTKESFGVIWKTAFKFPKQGIYVHYGVGRGWTRSGESVIRGKSDRYADYRKRDYTITNKNAKGRQATDWFNSVIKANIGKLADYTQEYYGDEATKKLLQEIDKMIIKSNK